jgi:glycerate kinase
MFQLNNVNALIRIFSRMVSCSYLVLMTMAFFLFEDIANSIISLLAIAFYIFFFSIYQEGRAVGRFLVWFFVQKKCFFKSKCIGVETFGTGELIKDALNKGCRNFIIGIGGSATNDAGLGMLQALGFRFLDKSGHTLGTGGQIMEAVANIDTSGIHPALRETHFMVACDVANPFYGPDGAAYIFAQQKGADSNMVQRLDEGMQSLAEVIKKTTGKDITNYPGAGAAGGMGGGLLAFFNAELKPGTELLLKAIDFSEKIKGADLIITGEGKADRQTAMGKVPYGILKEAQKEHIPVIVLAGSIENLPELNKAGFKGIFSIAPGPITLEKAMEPEFAKENITRLVSQLYSVITSFG